MPKLANNFDPVVLVDDNEDERFVASHCYERAGLPNPFIAHTSAQKLLEDLDRVLEGTQSRPALLLLDINMPFMDGFECLRQIRDHAAFENRFTIMMLTNSDNPDDMKRAEELGADGYKVKPTDLDLYVDFFHELAA